MKKIFAFGTLLTVTCLFAAPAMAIERGTPEYQKMVEIKKAQRQERMSKKSAASGQTAAGERKNGFWHREAQRSGLAGTGAMFGNAVTTVVPFNKKDDANGSK